MIPEPIVLLSALEHHIYCPRQCALIHVDGIWAENKDTIRGRRVHRRVDTPGGRRERDRLIIRALPLHSDRYGLAGRSDAIEIQPDGSLVPIEHKAGVSHSRAARVQLCGQALCLEDMFECDVPTGWIWYGGTKRRERVDIDRELRELTTEVAEKIRAEIIDGVLPEPVNDERCTACQLEPTCLPQVVFDPRLITRYVNEQVLGCE